MTELGQPEPLAEIVVPWTGELVPLTNPSQVARALGQVRDLKRQLDEARAVLEDALRLEAERQGTKTLHLDGLKATVTGGSKLEWDMEALADELRDAGLPEERLGQLIVQVITERVNATVANSIAKANPRYGEIVERHRHVVPDRWRVTVEGA